MKKEEDWEEFFEDDATRELKQIFQGQAALTDIVRELHRKMDEIIGTYAQFCSLEIMPTVVPVSIPVASVSDPDPYWIQNQSGQWIWIRIRNSDPDPGGQK